MLILGIDTSTDILALSIMEDQKLLGEYNLSLKRQHSEKLIPLIKEILALLNINPEDLDGVAVGIGPGSFTGVRIAITAAKMMGRINSIPVKGISTLEIMAAGVRAEYILPLIDARRNRIYYSLYRSNIKDAGKNKKINYSVENLFDLAAAELSDLPEIIKEYKEKEIMVVGSRVEAAADILKKHKFNICSAETENNFPRAAVIARLGYNYISKGKSDNIYELKPLYLKKAQAEINWQKKYQN
ncbi:MAG: tRNA (adenosine(37)-N6)-threonylcarbamoyltransferase complex dimerization subunit type 1 TsaB [Halanaerobium sp.]